MAGAAFEKEPEGEFRETVVGEWTCDESVLKRTAGCLDRAILQTSEGQKIDPKLWTIVDGVLRSSSRENGKLVGCGSDHG